MDDGVRSARAEGAFAHADDDENHEFTLHTYEPELDGSAAGDDGCADFDALDLDVEDGYLGAEGIRPSTAAASAAAAAAAAVSVEYRGDGGPSYERTGHCEPRDAAATGGVALRPSHDKLQRGVRSLWLHPTKAAEKGKASSAAVRETLTGLIVHGIFVAVLCGIVFGMINSSAYYFSNLVQSALVDAEFPGGTGSFRQSSGASDFWKFAGPNGVLIRELYGSNRNGSRHGPSAFASAVLSSASFDAGVRSGGAATSRLPTLLRQQSYLVSAARLRQLRVRSGSCEAYANFAGDMPTCYAVYSPDAEDRNPFGNGSEWLYRSPEDLGEWQSPYHGSVATYPGGGYVANLSTGSVEAASDILQRLVHGRWIDNATRVVFVEFTLYNANSNLFCFVRLATEFPPTGGTVTSFEIRTVKLLRYVTTGDFVVLGCEMIFIVFFVYFIVEAVMRVKRLGVKVYLRNVWNWFDWVLILTSAACIALNSYRAYTVSTYLEPALPSSLADGPYDFLSYWQVQFDYVVAVDLFFAWLKVFRYIKLNRPLAQMATTLDRCRSDLAAFSAMFIVVFLAFAQLAFLIFGSHVQGFSSFSETCISLLRMILGDVSIHELEAANRILGPLFFIVYTFVTFFILLNMFLAIVCEAYSDARLHVMSSKHEYNVTSYIKKQYSKVADKLILNRGALKVTGAQSGRSAACRSINAQHAAADGFDRVEEEDLGLHRERTGERDGRSRRSHTRPHASGSSSYTSRGDSDEYDDCCYDDDEGASSSAAAPRLRGSGAAPAASPHRLPAAARGCGSGCSGGGGGNGLAQEEFTVLTRRVDRMEHSIGSIVSKIDAVLVKLEAIEKAKARRKETLGKLLDGFGGEPLDGRSDEVKRDQMEELVRQELQRMTEGMDALYEA